MNILGIPPEIEKPAMSKEAFWEYQLSMTARYYEEYGYPLEIVRELRRIAEHCRTTGIELVFVIPPTHVSLQYQVAKYGLGKELERFRADLIELGVVYDFDYANPLTENQGNFKIPIIRQPRWRRQSSTKSGAAQRDTQEFTRLGDDYLGWKRRTSRESQQPEGRMVEVHPMEKLSNDV